MNLDLNDTNAWPSEPGKLVEMVAHMADLRQLRLFYCACVRSIWELLIDLRSQACIRASEEYADNRIDSVHLEKIRQSGYSAWYESMPPGKESREEQAAAAAFMTANANLVYARSVPACVAKSLPGGRSAIEIQRSIAQDILDRPYRTQHIPQNGSIAWSNRAESLARQIYSAQDYSLMPTLAAELQQSERVDPAMITHCNGNGTHFRGCWVIDTLLGFRNRPYS